MKAKTWERIYGDIENKKWSLATKRGHNSRGFSYGIEFMNDDLALEWQRLDRIQGHVGCHYCAQKDREEGDENSMCFYSTIMTGGE